MKVYVITAGEYSDYGICAVAVDPERAELLRKLYSGYDEAKIEEFDTEADTDKLNQGYTPVWQIYINRNGGISNIREWFYFGDAKRYENKFELSAYGDAAFSASICHPSRDVAIKIATDTRAKMLAERFGL